ncbi:uroporphyrinogen decarboxylase family protein [Candidatus Hydrogenedentota bacterium]
MNAKENALRIIRFDNPERVAHNQPAHNVPYHGCHHQGYEGGGHDLPVGSKWTDIWGTMWHKEHDGVMGFPRGNPLADLPKALANYEWPDPDDDRICGPIYEKAKEWEREETFLVGPHRDTLWEKSYMLVGMENMMCFFHTELNAVRELLHRIMDFQIGISKHYLDVGVEIILAGDDLGAQEGLLLSPQIIEEFLVPEYRRLFDIYKKHGVIISFHSCGHVTPMLETLIDLGVELLNPIQATANDLDEVRRITQGRMALFGGVSTRTVMAGPIEAIRKEVAFRLWQLGREGGYFCRPDQGMPWPEGHIEAVWQAVEEFGTYPLKPAAF